MPPLAETVPPSPFPLRFAEVVAFRGDFDNIGPHEVVDPKGVAYSSSLNRVIVSLSPASPPDYERVQMLTAVARDGSRVPFAPGYHTFRGVESLLAVVPPAGPPVAAGFTPGDVFVGRGPSDQISRLSGAGNVIADLFVDLGSGQGPWGGLTFDTHGAFGGRLIVETMYGKIFLVGSDGAKSQLTDTGRRLEGVAVAPAGFGPIAGHIIVGVEGSNTDPESGKVYAIDTEGNVTLLADIGFAAEDIQFVPPHGGSYYQCELCFDRERENRILSVSSSQFLSRLGRMLVVNELGGELWEVAWDGARYTQSLAGRVPGRWSSQGFMVQGTELEAGCFAVQPPFLATWTNWSVVPGGATTDHSPAVVADTSGNLHLLVKGINDRRIYMNNMWGATQVWTGWAEVPPGALTTNHALAAAMHNTVLYAFAIRDDGAIVYTRLFDGGGPWTEVPGGARTDAAVAATTANGRLVLATKDVQDKQIYLNELAPGARSWSGWYVVPGGVRTDTSPGLAAFQDELYVLARDPNSGHILTKVRTPDGDWSDWAQIPGSGVTDASIAAVSVSDQLYLFLKGVDDRAPYWNVASDTGTWSLWQAIPNGGATDVGLAATSIGNQVYLFAKGIDDHQLYMRYTPTIVHEWLNASGAPLVRFTGQVHDFSEPVGAQDVGKDIRALDLVISTGDDDLRGGSNAGDNCDVTVQLASGSTIRINNVNAGRNWKNQSVNTVTIPLPEGGLKGGDVKAVTLHTGFGGGISGDNWNVNRLQLQATLK
jgi:hypothetical protein